MSRSTRLTPALRGVIIEHIRAGNFPETSARAAGVPASTFYLWLKLGRAGRKPYVEFLELLDTAHAEAEVRVVQHLQSAIPTNWRAAVRWLEAHAGHRWAVQSSDASAALLANSQDASHVAAETEIGMDPLSTFLRDNPQRIPAVLGALAAIQAELDAVNAEDRRRRELARGVIAADRPFAPIVERSVDQPSR